MAIIGVRPGHRHQNLEPDLARSVPHDAQADVMG